jgi:hypothetical protein
MDVAPRSNLPVMSEVESGPDPLAGWDPRRRQALERLWASFALAGGRQFVLGDELISERRAEALAEDGGTAQP